MPRFYFDVRRDGRLYADEEGQELSDTDAAELEAAHAAAGIARDLLPAKRSGELVIELRDQSRRHLSRVS